MTTTNNSTNNSQLTTNGQLLIGSTSATPVVATITAGTNVTVTNGAGSISIASSGGGTAGLTWLASVTAASSATVNFDNKLSATYDNYLVVYEDVVPATNATTMQAQVGTGGSPTYQATNYNGVLISGATSSVVGFTSGTTQADLCVASRMANTSTTGACGSLLLSNCNDATNYKGINSTMTYNDSAASHILALVSAVQWQGATVLTSLRFQFSSGNVSTGIFKLYGYTN